MEIKYKLFTTIAQALDKLKKQFDKTDKSLVKTQTTLDETIVNIDNVVDSVARTMTEALDPYFVDMIYGYIDDNRKFKLGVIKDPWKDINTENARIADIIPINTKYIYHWGDKDVFNNVNKLQTLLNGHMDFIGDIDISLLFPNAYVRENTSYIIGNCKLNKLTINTSYLYKRDYYWFAGYAEINNLCIIYDTLDNTKVASFGNNCKIHNLELIGMKLLPRGIFHYCEFTFKSTKDIVGWNDIESIGSRAFAFAYNKMPIEEFYIGNNIKRVEGLELINIERLILEGSDKTIVIDTHPHYSIKELYIDSIDNYMTYNGRSPLHAGSYSYINHYVKIYENNTELTILTIPDNTSVITECKFEGFNVDKIILPDNLTEIENRAFFNRWAFTLQEIYVPSIDSFLNALFKGMTLSKYWLYYAYSFELTTDSHYEFVKTCQSTPNWSIIDKTTNIKIHEITITNSVYQLGDCCFFKCDIETINCNDLVTIGDCSFAFSNLTTIICDNVSTIGVTAFAFSNLKSLKVLKLRSLDLSIINHCQLHYMVISDKCESIIHNYSSDNNGIICDKLYINSNTPPTLNTTLDYIGKVYVPSTSINTFKTANKWSGIAHKIFPYDFELNPDNI